MHELLVHPLVAFQLKLGTRSSKVFPEFDSSSHRTNFPNPPAGG